MTGPLAPLFAQTYSSLRKLVTGGTIVCLYCNASDVTDDGHRRGCPVLPVLAALSSIERHVQEDVEEWERIAAEKGLPFLLDHLGLDGLANEVVERERHVQDMERALWAAFGKTTQSEIRDIIRAALSVPADLRPPLADHCAREGSQEGEK